MKKCVPKNLENFTGKHQCQRLFFHKVTDSGLQFYQKETLAQMFSYEFCKIFENNFFSEYLRVTASEFLGTQKLIKLYILLETQVSGKVQLVS